MKKLYVVLLLFCAFFKMFADDDDKIKLAVMEFEDLSGQIKPEILANATEYIRVVFASTNRYIIISKDRQKDTIKDMRKKFNNDPSYKSCTDKNCQIQLGQALSADLIVKTTVTYFAGSYTISSELIDLEKEATIIAAKEDYDGSDKALKNAIDKLVEKIVKVETEVNGEIAVQEKKPQKSSSSKDAIACEYARSESNDFAWKTYLEKYPNGECASEAKDNLDKSACKTAEKKNSAQGWKEYLKEFPDGKCEFKAQIALQKLKTKEEKEPESREKAEDEQLNFYTKADEKLNGIFSGRWNFGLGLGLNHYFEVGLISGLDFDFKVFSKPYGIGAGNLFIGFGFDLRYWMMDLKDDDIKHLINFPIQFNFGYEFKLSNPTLRYIRYIGLWTSLGMSVDLNKDPSSGGGSDTQLSFAWDITMSMIFKNSMMFNFGIGGSKSKDQTPGNEDWYWDHNVDLTIGTGVIF